MNLSRRQFLGLTTLVIAIPSISSPQPANSVPEHPYALDSKSKTNHPAARPLRGTYANADCTAKECIHAHR